MHAACRRTSGCKFEQKLGGTAIHERVVGLTSGLKRGVRHRGAHPPFSCALLRDAMPQSSCAPDNLHSHSQRTVYSCQFRTRSTMASRFFFVAPIWVAGELFSWCADTESDPRPGQHPRRAPGSDGEPARTPARRPARRPVRRKPAAGRKEWMILRKLLPRREPSGVSSYGVVASRER